MTMMHYVAVNKELPLGVHGSKISSKNKGQVIKAIKCKSAKAPEGVIPLEQIIDLPELKEDEVVVYDTL